MLFKASAIALLASVAFVGQAAANSHMDMVHGPQENTFDYRALRATIISQKRNLHARQAGTAASSASGGQAAAATCLDPAVIQTGSASTGQAATAEVGQVNSATDPANFINFCKGQVLTNGLQVKAGSCNGVVMGKIPSNQNMISSMLISPQPGENLTPLTTFNISVQVTGLAAGFFTNPALTYYAAPQDLDKNGNIIGHTHVTVQDLGKSLTPIVAPDPKTFVFFKGINNVGNGQGLLSATVTGGLPPGNYRVCTMVSAANHQAALMPVAQRGAQDDCTKFTVGGGPSGAGAAVGSGIANATSVVSVVPAVSSASIASSVTTTAASSVSSAVSSASASASAVVKVKSGTLGGAPPEVSDSGDAARPFAVVGNTFPTTGEAVQRSCDIQHNTCADDVNSGKLKGKKIQDCDGQRNQCQQG